MKANLAHWALVAPNDDTGIGRMAQDFMAVIAFGRHLVTPSDRLVNRPLADPRLQPLAEPDSPAAVAAALRGLEGILIIERSPWNRRVLAVARSLGVRSVCVPMWEWFRGLSPQWRNCDFFACPNRQGLAVVRAYGYDNSALVPWALDLARFPARRVTGPARHFVHNAGLVDPDDRKGTGDVLRAFARVPGRDLRLTVRVQRAADLPEVRDPRLRIEVGNLPTPQELYATGDAFVQPSKLEGLGFLVLEPVASGLPVITLDAAPMREWVAQPELRVRPGRFAYPAYSAAWIEHSHLLPPHPRDLAARLAWAAAHDLAEVSAANRAWAEREFAPARLLAAWTELFDAVVARPATTSVHDEPEPPLPCHRLASRLRQRIAQYTGWRLPFFRRPLGDARRRDDRRA